MFSSRLIACLCTVTATGLLFAFPTTAADPQTVIHSHMSVTKTAGNRTFTGNVTTAAAFKQTEPATLYGALVHFDAGARTYWHRHPLGQTLVVTKGVGLTQTRGGKIVQIKVGDIVVCPPNVEHWHGAAHDAEMEHLAISERHPSEKVTWLEAVSDKDYNAK